jgi:hypothetical protein
MSRPSRLSVSADYQDTGRTVECGRQQGQPVPLTGSRPSTCPPATALRSLSRSPDRARGVPQSGTLFVDDVTLAGLDGILDLPDGDEIAAVPYGYRIDG